MITSANLKDVLRLLKYEDDGNNVYKKYFPESDCSVVVDFNIKK